MSDLDEYRVLCCAGSIGAPQDVQPGTLIAQVQLSRTGNHRRQHTSSRTIQDPHLNAFVQWQVQVQHRESRVGIEPNDAAFGFLNTAWNMVQGELIPVTMPNRRTIDARTEIHTGKPARGYPRNRTLAPTAERKNSEWHPCGAVLHVAPDRILIDVALGHTPKNLHVVRPLPSESATIDAVRQRRQLRPLLGL